MLSRKYKYKVIDSLKGLKDFISEFKHQEFAWDTETTSLRYHPLQITAMSIYTTESEFSYVFLFNFTATYQVKVKDTITKKMVPLIVQYEKNTAIDILEAAPLLRKFFEGKELVTANGKFDYKVARKYGFATFTIKDDVNMMSFYIDSNAKKGLKINAKQYLGLDMISYAEVTKQKNDNINWDEVDWDKFCSYSGLDAFATYHLRNKLLPILKNVGRTGSSKFADRDAYKNYLEIGLPTALIAAQMEIDGIHIDVDYLKKMSVVANKEMEIKRFKVYESAGYSFDLNSPKQIGEVFFDKLGIEPPIITDKGNRSTNEEALKILHYREFDAAGYLLEYKKLSKLVSTYIDAIPDIVDGDGRLRGSFNNTGTSTGRWSSSEPNLQNQPNNKKFKVRNSFTAPKGKVFIVGDYSQIEFRLLTHFSKDPYLTDAYNRGADMHQFTADIIGSASGVHLSRNQGKTLNFAIAYLMQYKSLMENLNGGLRDMVISGELTKEQYSKMRVTPNQSKSIINSFFNTFTGFDNLVNNITRYAEITGFVSTIDNFCRPIPELQSKKFYSSGKRKALNTLIQGSAADIIKRLMMRAFVYMHENSDLKMLLQVHDELVWESDIDKAEKHMGKLKYLAENVFPECRVPILFDIGIYKTWGDAKAGNKLKLFNVEEYITEIQ